MYSNSDEARRSTLATLDEIVDGENSLKLAGIDVSDEGEWLQLRDIVSRIERRLMAQMSEPKARAAEDSIAEHNKENVDELTDRDCC